MHEQLRKTMNAKIQQLAEQAGFQYIKDQRIGWAGNHNASLLKFAQLIIVECAEVADGNWADPGHQIKLHFEISDPVIQIGNRVVVIAGFNVGANGTVNYIEPGGKLWVRRDGASSDVFYHLDELKVIPA